MVVFLSNDIKDGCVFQAHPPNEPGMLSDDIRKAVIW